MRAWKHGLYIAVAAAMIIIALPRLDISGGWNLPTVFGVVWLCFALMIIASHLHQLLGVDEAEKERLEQIKRVRKHEMQQLFQGRKSLLHRSGKSRG